MLPSFRPNDLVLCLKLKKYTLGAVVIVKNSDHGPILKRIKGIRDSRLEISSENKEYSSETTKITYDLDDAASDWHSVEKFATGKTDEIAQQKKQAKKEFIEKNPSEDLSNRYGDYDPPEPELDYD